MMRNTLKMACLIFLLFSWLALVFSLNTGEAQNFNAVSGIIDSDTVWTKAESPYTLTGLVVVSNGTTLTIEPGVTVNLGEYSLQVAGSLHARGGRGTGNITFVSQAAAYGNIAFTNNSTSWDEGSRSGSIIENAILVSTSISIQSVSPRINNNTVAGNLNIDYGAAPMISNNLLNGDIGVHSGSPTIFRNSIIGGINIGGDSPVILNNTIRGGGITGYGIKFDSPFHVEISNNIVYNCSTGVSARGPATIKHNLLIDNERGLEVLSSPQILIQNNTIANNIVGIRLSGMADQIGYRVTTSGKISINGNNIQNNVQSSIYLEDNPADVDATQNWWGTIEQQLISLTIHDKKNEPKLGAVIFVPTLSDPVPEAPTEEYTPITWTLSTSQTEAELEQSEPQNPAIKIGLLEIAVAAIIFSVVVNIALVVVVVSLFRKRR